MYDPIKDTNDEGHDMAMRDFTPDTEERQSTRAGDDESIAEDLHYDTIQNTTAGESDAEDDDVGLEEEDDYSSSLTDASEISDADTAYEEQPSSPAWHTHDTKDRALVDGPGRRMSPDARSQDRYGHNELSENGGYKTNGKEDRSLNGVRTIVAPVRSSHPMSISAMLSNPVEVMRKPETTTSKAHITTKSKITKARTPKRKRGDDSTAARLPKTKTTSEKKKKRETRKPRVSTIPSYNLEDSLLESDISEMSDDDQYMDSRAKYLDDWSAKCAKIVAAEQLAQRRRSVEVSGRLLVTLDRRVRKITKSFDNRHYRSAMIRATFEDGVRREQQRKGLLSNKKSGKAASTTMAPPTISKKMSKKQKKKELAAAAAAAAAAALEAQRESNADETSVNGKNKKPSSANRIEGIHDSIWKDIVRKEIPKVHRIIQTNNVNRTINLKKTGQLCAKEARRWQSRTNKTAKDMQAKSKRAMREMLIFWKRNERGDLMNRQKAEKEIIDRAKKEEEDRESRRQARKLNFLITQTELYSHFIGSKVKTAEAEQSEDTAGDVRLQMDTSQHTPPVNVQPLKPGETAAELDFDADDDDALRAAAARNAQEAVQKAKEKAQGFDTESGSRAHVMTGDLQADADAMNLDFQNPTTIGDSAIAQPKMLNATLKEYQLKGLNWLVNLYEQGINGILADEMGLGKTVQSISVMAHLAETYNIWGPFLVIAPASTLHNWQQEITKFVPRLKALPYWGNTKDRKVLRKFWDRKRATYTEDAPFHVVITSYQLVVQDSQYFQNVKWQYMILDEAQAIKSSSSSRWKNLLGFKCRNRLLLTGTPIQNTMQELWALLHFIMPSLFDSHNEFSEWFSKDIESHAQKNSELNEEQLKRLHMILKPFMLRRVKKNVQKELGDKIELDVFCDLNMRQRGLYSFLRREISMKDILEKASSDKDADLSSLMNLVMQLRKVCNHPDLFERADVRAPLALVDMPKTANIAKEGRSIELSYAATSAVKYHLPKFIYRAGGLLDVPSETSVAGSRKHCLHNLMNIFSPEHVLTSAKTFDGAFSWVRPAGLTPTEIVATYRDPLRAAATHLAKDGLQDWHTAQVSQAVTKAQSFLQITKSGRPSLSTAALHGAMADLLNIHRQVAETYGYHRIEPVYDPTVLAPPVEVLCPDRTFIVQQNDLAHSERARRLMHGLSLPEESAVVQANLYPDPAMPPHGALPIVGHEKRGYNSIRMPSMQTFITDSGKLSKLDELLTELKKNDHRVLLYFQMTKMIDLMEEYLVYRQYKYLRLDGSSKISDRRDMVSDWQTRPELFVFLLSTRAGGLGINLTAADTVIFYDSDWNPTIDSQAMDRAHRLGQTKQVTVYRLITRGSIEERILSRAKEKEEVQKVVISGGDYKQGTTDNIQFQAQKGGGRDVVSWLLEDDDQVKKVSQQLDSMPANRNKKAKARTGPSLDDMYHEGENRMESEAQTPEIFNDGEPDEPVRKKKKLGSKKPRLQEL